MRNDRIICTVDADGIRWASLEDLERIIDELGVSAIDDDADYYGIWRA